MNPENCLGLGWNISIESALEEIAQFEREQEERQESIKRDAECRRQREIARKEAEERAKHENRERCHRAKDESDAYDKGGERPEEPEVVMVRVSVQNICNHGAWDEYCEAYGINVWARNEGLMSEDEVVSITADEAREWGIV